MGIVTLPRTNTYLTSIDTAVHCMSLLAQVLADAEYVSDNSTHVKINKSLLPAVATKIVDSLRHKKRTKDHWIHQPWHPTGTNDDDLNW